MWATGSKQWGRGLGASASALALAYRSLDHAMIASADACGLVSPCHKAGHVRFLLGQVEAAC